MSDGSRVFSAIKKSLRQLFPKMEGHQDSHFGTLLHMITGMVVSKHCHLPQDLRENRIGYQTRKSD